MINILEFPKYLVSHKLLRIISSFMGLSLSKVNLVRNCKDRLLDLVFVSNLYQIIISCRTASLFNGKILCCGPVQKQYKSFCFRKADFCKVNSLLHDTSWSEINYCANLNTETSLL